MWWLDDIIVPAVLVLGVCCFVILVRRQAQRTTNRSTRRTVESMYPIYADSLRKQRKYAKEHGGTWEDDGGLHDALTKRPAPPPKTRTRPAGPTPKPRP